MVSGIRIFVWSISFTGWMWFILGAIVFVLVIPLSCKYHAPFQEISAPPTIESPECGSMYMSGFDGSCCKLTYYYFHDDPFQCEHQIPLLQWKTVEHARWYEVYINDMFYARTEGGSIQLGAENPEDPNTLLPRLRYSTVPYSWFVQAVNTFQISPSNRCYFCLWDDIPPLITLDSFNGLELLEQGDTSSFLYEFSLLDDGLVRNIQVRIDDQTYSYLDQGEIGVDTFSTSISVPTQCGDIISTTHDVEICAEDGYGNHQCKSQELSLYCVEPEEFCDVTLHFPVNGPLGGMQLDTPPVLDWEPLECATHYILYYKPYQSDSYVEIEIASTATQFDFGELPELTSGMYEWSMSAHFDSGMHLQSEIGWFELLGYRDPPFVPASCGYPLCGTGLNATLRGATVEGAVFYRLQDTYNPTIYYPAFISPTEMLHFDINQWFPSFGVRCSITLLACLEENPKGTPGEYSGCRRWVYADPVGVACENAGFETGGSCGQLFTGDPGCPCTLTDTCSPGTGCVGQLCP